MIEFSLTVRWTQPFVTCSDDWKYPGNESRLYGVLKCISSRRVISIYPEDNDMDATI